MILFYNRKIFIDTIELSCCTFKRIKVQINSNHHKQLRFCYQQRKTLNTSKTFIDNINKDKNLKSLIFNIEVCFKTFKISIKITRIEYICHTGGSTDVCQQSIRTFLKTKSQSPSCNIIFR